MKQSTDQFTNMATKRDDLFDLHQSLQVSRCYHFKVYMQQTWCCTQFITSMSHTVASNKPVRMGEISQSVGAFTAGLLIQSSRLLRITGKWSMKGRRGLDQEKIAWLSDRMCLVTHSLFLLEPRQPTKATHGRGEGWGGGYRTCVCVCVCACICVCVWRKRRYIVPCFCLERLWDASKMPTAVTASSTKCSCGNHTHKHNHTHTQIATEPLEKNTPNVFRKLLWARRENHFFPFSSQTNKQLHPFPSWLHWANARSR